MYEDVFNAYITGATYRMTAYSGHTRIAQVFGGLEWSIREAELHVRLNIGEIFVVGVRPIIVILWSHTLATGRARFSARLEATIEAIECACCVSSWVDLLLAPVVFVEIYCISFERR